MTDTKEKKNTLLYSYVDDPLQAIMYGLHKLFETRSQNDVICDIRKNQWDLLGFIKSVSFLASTFQAFVTYLELFYTHDA